MLISCHKYVCQTRSQPDISYEKRCRWVTSGGLKLHLSIDVKIVRWEKSELYLTNSEQSSTIHNWLVYLRCFTSMHFPACRKKSGTSKGMIEMPLKKKKKKREKATNSDHEKWDRMWHHITSSHQQEGPFCLSLYLDATHLQPPAFIGWAFTQVCSSTQVMSPWERDTFSFLSLMNTWMQVDHVQKETYVVFLNCRKEICDCFMCNL